MIVIHCINAKWSAPFCNKKLNDCECWLRQHVGERRKQWDWAASGYGYVIISSEFAEEATLFKLKFGV